MIVEKLIGTSQNLTDDRLRCVLDDAISRPESPVGIYLNPQNVDFVSGHLQDKPCWSRTCNCWLMIQFNWANAGLSFKTTIWFQTSSRQLDEIEAHLAELINE